MKFKGFWSSLWNLYKECGRWYRDYWFLYCILCVILCIPVFVWIYWSAITEWFHKKRKKVKVNKEDEREA